MDRLYMHAIGDALLGSHYILSFVPRYSSLFSSPEIIGYFRYLLSQVDTEKKMEHLQDLYEILHSRTDNFKNELHKFLAKYPLANKHIGDAASTFGLSRAAFICFIVVAILTVILRITSISFISALIGISFPLYKTNESLSKNDKKCKKSILCYWLIYFIIYQFERTVLALLPYISFYVFLKTGFLISCYSLQFKQSEEICFSIIKLIHPYLAELKSFIGDGGVSNSRDDSTNDKSEELLYGIEVHIDSAELDVDKDTSVICQVSTLPPANRQAFGIEKTKFKSQVLIGKKNFSFKKTIYLYPINSLDGTVKIELKEKDTFTDESESTVFLSCEKKVSELTVGSAFSDAPVDIFSANNVRPASLTSSFCVIQRNGRK